MKKRFLSMLAVLVVSFNVVCSQSVVLSQAKTDTITVKTQNELDNALKKAAQNTDSVKSVIVKSNQLLEINKGDYSNTELIIDSSKANVVNYGTWKDINISKAEKFSENASGNHISSSGKKLILDIRKIAEGVNIDLTGNKTETTVRIFGKVSNISSDGNNSKVIIRIDGVLDDVVINEKSVLVLKGAPIGDVKVALKAEETWMKTSVKTDVSVYDDSVVRFLAGSEGSIVKTVSPDAWAKVVSVSASNVTMYDEDGRYKLHKGEKEDLYGVAETGLSDSGNIGSGSGQTINGVFLPGVYTVSGEYIIFGEYEQDGNTENGAEPIEWEILGKDENGILVVSKNILDCQPYNTKNENVTWESCSLRKWLNGTFYDTAFADNEKSRIEEVQLENTDNGRYGSKGGKSTNDRVFCLGVNDVLKYYSLNQYYEDCVYGYFEQLIASPSDYAKKMGTYTYNITKSNYEGTFKGYGYSTACIEAGGGRWWLRTPGLKNNDACIVGACGNADAYYNSVVCGMEIGVRPAIYLDPSEQVVPEDAGGDEDVIEEDTGE